MQPQPLEKTNRFDHAYEHKIRRLPQPGQYFVWTSYGGAYVIDKAYDVDPDVSELDAVRLRNWRRQVWRLFDIVDPSPDDEPIATSINKADLVETIKDLEADKVPAPKPQNDFNADDLASLVSKDRR